MIVVSCFESSREEYKSYHKTRLCHEGWSEKSSFTTRHEVQFF